MNIFFLHPDPAISNKYHFDSHVGKLGLEAWQMLRCVEHYVWHLQGLEKQPAYYNHGCSKWARRSVENAEYLYAYGKANFTEFEYRRGKRHGGEALLDNVWKSIGLSDYKLPSRGLTEPYLAMPTEVSKYIGKLEKERDLYTKDSPKISVAVCTLYRAYYSGYKRHLISYTKRPRPSWINTAHFALKLLDH